MEFRKKSKVYYTLKQYRKSSIGGSILTKATPYFIAIAVVALVTFGAWAIDSFSESTNTICTQQYALCTSAPCIPDPTDATKSICFCTVQSGKSFGQTSCAKRAPLIDKNGIHFITSTYSFVEYATKKTMYCDSGNAWSFCLDKKCTVDPQNPTRAICTCDVKRTEKFLTLGGNCDTKTCSNAYWSGATLEDTSGAMEILVKAMGLKQAPSNYCPGIVPGK